MAPLAAGTRLRVASVSANTLHPNARRAATCAPVPALRTPPANTTLRVPDAEQIRRRCGGFQQARLAPMASGMRGGVLLGRKLQLGVVRNKRAQECNGDGRHINCLEPTDKEHQSAYRERTPDLRRTRTNVASIAPRGAESRQGNTSCYRAPSYYPPGMKLVDGHHRSDDGRFFAYFRRPFRSPVRG